jgi:ferredoxin-NADP reductase
MAVTATGPMGTFTDEVAGGSKWALLAAGSGITPVMSMLRRAADLGEDRDIVLIDSAHTPSDLIFHDELAILARALSGLRIIHLVSQGHPGWSGLRGRLSRATLELLVPDLRERAVFCCGPPAYGAAVQGWAAEIGCHPANYHTESFNFESAEAELSPAPAQSDVQLYTITFAQSGRTLTCDAATTVLAAARQAGLRLPFSCAKGVCGTCKTKIISGDVEMTHNGGIRPREIAQGLALLCCSRPKTDLLVDR